MDYPNEVDKVRMTEAEIKGVFQTLRLSGSLSQFELDPTESPKSDSGDSPRIYFPISGDTKPLGS